MEVPPPGVGVVTVIDGVPPDAISAARMVALSWVLSMNVVALPIPFIFTTDELVKFEPLTVKGKLDPPAHTTDGEMLVMEGTGLLTLNALLVTVKDEGVDVANNV